MEIGKKVVVASISNNLNSVNLPYQNQILLSVENLSVFHQDQPILKNFSLTLRAGEWIAIKGRNGCGKTTLLKTIVGLVQPVTGLIQCCDYAFMGHANGLKDDMTVRDHLNFVARWFNAPLKPTPVDGLADLYIYQLSAGLKRQLALSQFIFCNRPLWIMDEPLDNLDTQARDYFLNLMRQHVNAGGAILQTSHDLQDDKAIREIHLV